MSICLVTLTAASKSDRTWPYSGSTFCPASGMIGTYMATITRDDVLKLARLSRLDLTDEEVDEFTAEIGEILRYVEMLQNADVAGLEPTSQVTGLTNVTRLDEEIDYGYEAADLLKNLPEQQDNQIKVRKMLG